MRGFPSHLPRYRVGDLVIDVGTREVRRGNELIAMPRLSFELLLALVRNAPNVLSNDDLIAQVWSNRVVSDETVAKRVELVRQALGDDSRQPRYIALARGHGYRIAARVDLLDAAPAPISEESKPKRTAARIGWASLVSVCVATVLGGVVYLREGRPTEQQLVSFAEPAKSLAVLPLDNLSKDAEQDYLAAGIHEALIADLSKARSLKVISRTSTLPYRNSGKSMQQIARELGVELVMEGSVIRDGDRLRLTVQLIDASDTHLWAQSYDREVRDVLRMQSELAQSVARAIDVALTPAEQARLSTDRIVNPQTYELYLKGAYYLNQWTHEGNEKGIALLHRATRIDPSDPLPYAKLALAYSRIGHAPGAAKSAFPRSTAAELQALGLDDGIAEAHLALAENSLYFHWDWDAAESSLRKALEINPSLADAHAHYAWLHVLHGRLDRALEEMELAIELDPQESTWVAWHGWISNWCGRHEAAIAQLQKALAMDPEGVVPNFVLGQAYAALGRHDDAAAAFKKAADRSPRWAWGLAQGQALAGRHAEARTYAAGLEQEEDADPWALAEIYVALGEHDRALTWLEKGYEIRRDWMPWMESNAFFQPLRGHERFKEIVRRLNLPESRTTE